MCNIVGTFEDRIQKAFSTAIGNNITPRIALGVRLINASSGLDVTSVTAISDSGERIGVTAFLENLSSRNNTLYVLTANDETRKNIPNGRSDLSIQKTNFDRQPQTHHTNRK